MNAIAVIVAFVILATGIYFRQTTQHREKGKGLGPVRVIVAPAVSPGPTAPPTNTSASRPSPVTRTIQSPTATPAPLTTPGSDDWKYPGSSVISRGTDRLSLETPDEPATVTSWYENRIRTLGYSARTSVRTQTNGNTENKLAASGRDGTISITVTRNSGGRVTSVTVAK